MMRDHCCIGLDAYASRFLMIRELLCVCSGAEVELVDVLIISVGIA